jgi:hypothetical protein
LVPASTVGTHAQGHWIFIILCRTLLDRVLLWIEYPYLRLSVACLTRRRVHALDTLFFFPFP